MKRLMMAFGASVTLIFAVSAKTCNWIGGSGDWDVLENWQDRAKPGADDIAKFPATEDITVTIPEEGVAIKCVISTTGTAVTTLAGGQITLSDQLATVTLSPFVFDTPLKLTYSGVAYFRSSSSRRFNAPITLAASVSKVLFAAETSSKDNGGACSFYSLLDGEHAQVEIKSPCTTYAGANFKVARVFAGSGWANSSHSQHYAPEMDVLCYMTGDAYTYLNVENVLPKAVIRPGYNIEAAESSSSIYLKADQTFDRLDDNDTGTGLVKWGSTTKSYILKNASGGSALTVTLNGTANGNSPILITGAINVIWNPTNDFTQSFSNRTHTMTGTLTVKRGAIKMVGTTSFAQVPTVTVADGASFINESTVAESLKGLKTLTLGENARFSIGEAATEPIVGLNRVTLDLGAKLSLPENCAVSAALLTVDGSYPAPGTYTGAAGVPDATQVDWIEGAGTVTVINANTTSWKAAASGDWDNAGNWTAGVPTADTKTTIAARGADYAVDLSAASVWPKDILIANPNVTVRVTNGVDFIYNGSGKTTSTKIQNGARFRVAGGFASFTNYVGTFTVEGSAAATSAVEVAGGTFSVRVGSATGQLTLKPQGEIRISDGEFRNLKYTASATAYESVLFAGGRLVATGGRYYPIVGEDSAINDGEAVFGGSSRWAGSTKCIRMNPAAGKAATLTFAGAADKDASGYLYMGGTDGGVSTLNLGSTKTYGNFGYAMLIGRNFGTAVLNMSSGTLNVGERGIEFGTGDAKSAGATKGVLNLSGGTISYTTQDISGWSDTGRPIGLLVGYGGYTSVTDGRPYVGEVNLSGGDVLNSFGHTLIGAGHAKGTWKQTDGAYENKYSGSSWGCGMIGAFGGEGSLEMSGGTFVFASNMYVGGGRTNDLVKGQLYAKNGLPADSHSAQGSLTFSGGTMTFKKNLVVGSNGTGTLARIGSQGTLTVNNLQLAAQVVDAGLATETQTEATLRFALDADGIGQIAATKATINDGTKVEVDFSAYAGTKRSFRLIGTDDLTVDVNNLVPSFKDESGRGLEKGARLQVKAGGLYAAFAPLGVMLIVR